MDDKMTSVARGALIGGKYRLRSQIGEGAMGIVWSAVNEATDRPVAVKLVSSAHASNAELRTRMLREARACGRIVHKNVVEIFDAGQTDSGAPYLVMPLLTGESLASLLERVKKLPQAHAVRIATEIARGLAAAHAAGIVHRDLKPANIFLSRETDEAFPTVKILDFGVSKLIEPGLQPSETVTGGVLGSPLYMSPEQAVGSKTIDQRSDLWALGVVFYKMLVGVAPFDGDSVFVVASKILHGDIPAIRQTAPHVDAWVSDLVAKCLTREVDQRIASANDFVQFVKQHNDASGVLPPLDSVTKVLAAAGPGGNGPSTEPFPRGPQASEPSITSVPLVPVAPESNPDLFGAYPQQEAPKSVEQQASSTTMSPFMSAVGRAGPSFAPPPLGPLPLGAVSTAPDPGSGRKSAVVMLAAVGVGLLLGVSVLFVMWSRPQATSPASTSDSAVTTEPAPPPPASVAATTTAATATTTIATNAPPPTIDFSANPPSSATTTSTRVPSSPGGSAKPPRPSHPTPKPKSSSSTVPFQDPG